MESKLKHLEMIQGVINRMASNSFRLKGWSIVLISALLVLIARQDESQLSYIGLFPVIAFWCLDAYFLRQESLYRALYDHVRVLEPTEIDFSMDTESFREEAKTWRCALGSTTLVVFYVAIAAAVIVAVIVNDPMEVARHGT